MIKDVHELEDYSKREDLETLSKLLENWLSLYTEEVIKRVMPRINEILASEMTMNLLAELYEREAKEREQRKRDMEFILEELAIDEDVTGQIENYHNYCLTHAKSYRDILYDLYIK